MNVSSWPYEYNFVDYEVNSFWASYKHVFPQKKINAFTCSLQKVVGRYCCQKFEGRFAAKQNKIAKSKMKKNLFAAFGISFEYHCWKCNALNVLLCKTYCHFYSEDETGWEERMEQTDAEHDYTL